MASIQFPIAGTDKPHRAGLVVASAEEDEQRTLILSGDSTIERNFQTLPGSMVAISSQRSLFANLGEFSCQSQYLVFSRLLFVCGRPPVRRTFDSYVHAAG